MSARVDQSIEYLKSVRDQFLTDDKAFCAQSLSVQSKRGQLVPFDWNPAQEKLDALIKKQQKRGRPVRIVILKSRRAGFSTGVAGKLFKETPFQDGQATLVVAHELKAVKESIYPMYHRFQKNYRPFGGIIGLPALAKETQEGIEWTNGSKIQIATANNLEGARSFGFRRVHLSEFAFYRDAKTLMTALMQTVPDDPDTIVIVESTANGVGGPFYDLWQEANNPNRESEWEPLFFAWFDDPDNWRALEVPPDKFQESLTQAEREMMRQYRLHLEQLNWRRWCIANKCERDERIFQQEYPANAEEAFLVSGRPRFDHAAINRFQAVKGTVGELQVEQVGVEKRLFFVARERGALEVWRKPEKGRRYVIGADTAQGIDANAGEGTADPDYSVAQVRDLDTGEQVARLRERLTERAFGEYLYYLARWFNDAYIVPEVTGGNGRAALDKLLDLGYPMTLIYHTRDEKKGIPPRYEDLGWETTTVTRPKLISTLDTAIMEHSIETYDAVTIQEYRTFVINKDGKPEAQRGCHDDCVIADGLSVIGILRAPRPAQSTNTTPAARYGMTERERARQRLGSY